MKIMFGQRKHEIPQIGPTHGTQRSSIQLECSAREVDQCETRGRRLEGPVMQGIKKPMISFVFILRATGCC